MYLPAASDDADGPAAGPGRGPGTGVGACSVELEGSDDKSDDDEDGDNEDNEDNEGNDCDDAEPVDNESVIVTPQMPRKLVSATRALITV